MKHFIKFNKLLGSRSEAGIGIVDALVASLFVMGGAVLLTKIGRINLEVDSFKKSAPVMVRYNQQLMLGAKNVLIDTKDSTGKAVLGLCKLTKTASRSGLGYIQMSFFPETGRSARRPVPFSNGRWSSKFPGWTLVNTVDETRGCKEIDNYTKCFNIKPENRLELNSRQMQAFDIAGSVKIIPTIMSPEDERSRIFIPANLAKTKSFDVKQVGFKILTTITYRRPTKGSKFQRFIKTKEEFLWAPTAGSCLSLDKTKALSLSGSGPSSIGNTIYNSPVFAKSSDKSGLPDPVAVSFKKIHAQEGQVDAEGQIATNAAANVIASCNEVNYRCPVASNDRKRTYHELDLVMKLEFKPDSNAGFSKNSSITPSLKIKRGVSEVSNIDVQYSMDGVTGKNFNVSSTHGLEAKVFDRNSKNATNLCRNVCQQRSNYNLVGSRYNLGMGYYLGTLRKGGSVKIFDDTSIRCTACYMKSCERFGLGTFGPMDKQPNQPLDATIPECWLQYSDPPINATLNLDSTYNKNRSCVAAQVIFNPSGRPGIRYRNERCNKRLPVMCFNYGTFVLAKRRNSNHLVYKRQNQAARTCFEMGFESVRMDSLDTVIGVDNRDGQMPSNNGRRYRYFNLAQQGIFLAPHMNRDLRDYVKWAEKKENGVPRSTWFWVALNTYQDPTTNAVRLKAMTPFLANSNIKSNDNQMENNAVYYGINGNLRNKFYNYDLSAFKPDSGAAGRVLVHSVKYKGVARVSPGNNFRSVCYSPSAKRIFISSKSSSYAGAQAVCQNECSGCIFPRLGSSLDWIRALNLVQPNMSQLPFPNPRIDNINQIRRAWVFSDE